jgi:hypothetical protein
MAIKKDTLDDLLAGRDPKAVFSKDGLFDELKKALAERVLNAELDDHLDNEAAEGFRNRRNGSSKKTVLTETAKIDIRIPRDREGTFDPKLIQRYQRRFPGFDDKIVSMYARGALELPDGRQRVVRRGHDPARPIQTGIGPVEVSKPKARDRGATRQTSASAIRRRFCRNGLGGRRASTFFCRLFICAAFPLATFRTS